MSTMTKPCIGCGNPVPIGAFYFSPCARENLRRFFEERPWLKPMRGY